MTDWERCRPWIEAALTRQDTHGIEDVAAYVAANPVHFWAGRRSVLITEFIEYPRYRAFRLWLGGAAPGQLRDLMALTEHAVAWAKAEGAERVIVMGRKGWARALRHYGFQPMCHVAARSI